MQLVLWKTKGHFLIWFLTPLYLNPYHFSTLLYHSLSITNSDPFPIPSRQASLVEEKLINQSRHWPFQLFLQKIRPWIRMGGGNLFIPFIFHWVILKMISRKSDLYYSHLTTYSLNYFAGLGTKKNWLKTDQSGVASSTRVISQQMKSVRREARKNESKLNI